MVRVIVFTSRRLFVLISTVFSLKDNSKVFFLGANNRIADMGCMLRGCSVDRLGAVVVVVSVGWGDVVLGSEVVSDVMILGDG